MLQLAIDFTAKLCNLMPRREQVGTPRAKKKPQRLPLVRDVIYKTIFACTYARVYVSLCRRSPKKKRMSTSEWIRERQRPTHSRKSISKVRLWVRHSEIKSHKFLYNFLPNAIERNKFHKLVTVGCAKLASPKTLRGVPFCACLRLINFSQTF